MIDGSSLIQVRLEAGKTRLLEAIHHSGGLKILVKLVITTSAFICNWSTEQGSAGPVKRLLGIATETAIGQGRESYLEFQTA